MAGAGLQLEAACLPGAQGLAASGFAQGGLN